VLSGDGTERKFTLRSNTSQEILEDFNEDSTFREIIASMSLERMKVDAINKMDSKLCVYCTQPSTDIIEINKEAETCDGEITISLDTQLICRNKNCQFLVKAKVVPTEQQQFPVKLMMFIVQKTMGHCDWSHNGKLFSISNRILFSMTTLPLHFPNLNFDDFVKELKKWGFQVNVLSQGADFSHPSFQRDDPMLVFEMMRTNSNFAASQINPQALLTSSQDKFSTQSILSQNLPIDVTMPMVSTNMSIGPMRSINRQLPSLERKEKVPMASIAQKGGASDTQIKPRMFFESLRAALDDEATNDIISWTGEGQTFAILNQDLLVALVLPKYFSSTCDLERFLSLLDSHDFTFTGHGVFSHPGFHREKFKKKKKSVARRAETRKQPRFPDALFLALQDDSIKHIISWTDDGKSIWVKDKDLLVTEVYPKHFSWMIKMQDFYNGLCNYNFKAEARGAGKYSNPDFRRDSPGLVVKSKNSSAAKKRAAQRAKQQVEDMKEAYKKAGFDADKIPDAKEG